MHAREGLKSLAKRVRDRFPDAIIIILRLCSSALPSESDQPSSFPSCLPENVALLKVPTQSSTIAFSTPASKAVDGSTNGRESRNKISHTAMDNNPWLQVDLQDTPAKSS